MKLLISDKFDKINVFKKNNLNFYLILVSSFSLMWFLIKEGTAYQWPAIDMVPFLKQALGQSQLVNDFFYNTSFKPNPRFIFGYVMLGIIKLFSLDWYTGLYTLKLILVITIPIAYFCFIRIVLKRYIADEAIKYTNPIIFLFIIAVIIPRIGNLLQYPEEVEKLMQYEAVILEIPAGRHNGKIIEYTIAQAEKYNCKLEGAILTGADEKLLKTYYFGTGFRKGSND